MNIEVNNPTIVETNITFATAVASFLLENSGSTAYLNAASYIQSVTIGKNSSERLLVNSATPYASALI